MSNQPSRFLIIGGSGIIGRHLFAQAGPERAVATWHSREQPGMVHFDPATTPLTPFIQEHGPFSHALILHGLTRLDACARDKIRSHEINVVGIQKLIEGLLSLGIKPLFTSTDQVFDGCGSNYNESDVPNPLSTYGRQKVAVEKFLQETGEDHAIIRLSKVYGTEPHDGMLLANWFDALRREEHQRLAEDELFSPVLMEDVTTGLMRLVADDLSGLFHLCGPMAISRAGMFRRLLAHLREGGIVFPEPKVTYCRINDFDFLEERPLNISMNPVKWIRATRLMPLDVESACKRFVSLLGDE
ncbi:MAG: sugar nucleotide-binding protein [Magnetococcales bacterium]|nr:sugar nucleotide-binding protein [Magnetococcales bacterium]